MNKLSDEEIRFLEERDLCPRVSLLEEELNTQLLDERYLQTIPLIRKMIYKLLPVNFALIMEAWIIHRQYDAVLSYYERVGLPFAYLQKIFGSDTPHILLTTWLSSDAKVWFLKRVHEKLSKIVTWSSVQRDYAINEIGVSPEKIKLLKRGTDQKFWRPMKAETDMICSAGMEMRDYPTMIEALKSLDIPCHIATGKARGQLFDTVKRLYEMDDIPRHITVGSKSYLQMREMYARSRFVVVPLLETDTDNGLTVILEAMAMGKAVICSEVEGQVDVIEDGVTGVYVPQGDAKALRKAILDLWNNPEKAEKMGKAAREHIEKVHNLEQFVDGIKAEITKKTNGVRETVGSLGIEKASVEV
ncbi:MAG TPA: glycosyltransferase family 4 protein [Balneolaceae bacterium]